MINNMTIQPLSGVPNSIQGGVLMPPGYQPNIPSIANYSPGRYSQLAYQMAGSPSMGPWASSAPPPLQPYSTGGLSGSGGSGASSVVGLLNDANKAKNLYNNVTGLLNPGVSQSDLASLYANQAAPATVDPLVTTPAQAGVTPVQGPLYEGASNSNADVASQEANNYTAAGGLLGTSAAAGAGSAAPVGTISILDDAGNVVAGAGAEGAAGGAAGADAAAGAGAEAGSGSSAGLGAAAGTAAAIALPAAMTYAELQNLQTNSGLAFTKSLGTQVNGKYGGMFTQDQYNQIQQAYHQLGENGFWQWFQKNYPGFTGPGTSNVRASYKPT